ncbi:hypothetical protein [Chitinophaga japonensis]|uniref:Uncharacterized protein n=1 Tax=Chitinophaga japonensis TaxID=104662 RepID=A0A562TEN0_CHIJA|nr:hypothetical protein [Chitinophaga japonensis]TWI91556.1 hypothetical protein LX66_0928 [Chitinophaga japonensis]
MKKLYRSIALRRYLLLSPLVLFPLLMVATPLNRVYCGSIALALGAVAVLLYRPDLKKKMSLQSAFFLLLCLFYYAGMLLLFPEYVAPQRPSSPFTFIAGTRPEELLLVFTAGMYWSGLFNIFAEPASPVYVMDQDITRSQTEIYR